MTALREHYERLFGHLEWADRKVLDSLRAADLVLKSIMDLYAHVLGAEHTWLSRISGAGPEFTIWPSLTLDECDSLARQNCEQFGTIVEQIDEESIQRPITYRNSAGDEYTSSLDDILTHVALHGAYHRGQIALSLRGSGEVPAPTDYIAFTRGAPAATNGRR